MQRCLLLIICISITFSCSASLEGELEKYFDRHSEVNNVSGPSAYKGQRGGYYTGGSIFTKTPSSNIHPITLQLPQYSAGCGGIDLFTGGFSYINSNQLVSMMRNIGNNAQGLAFSLGMKTVMPMVENLIGEYLEKAQKINQFNINSCEIASLGLNKVWPQAHAANDVECRANANSSGFASSNFDSRLECSAHNGAINNQQNSVTNLNMAWKAIKSSPLFSEDNQFAEFLMSLSGTLIFYEGNQNLNMLDLPSLASNSNLIQALVYGGDSIIYRCDTYTINGCLRPKPASISIKTEKSLGYKVTKILNEIVNRMENNEELTSAHIALLNSTSIPVYRILNVYTTYAPATKMMDIQHYAELIAYDLLYHFLVENIKNVEQLSRAQLDIGNIGQDFFIEMQKAREQVDRERARTAEQANHVLSLIEKAKNVEKELAGQFSSSMRNSIGKAHE